MMNKNQLYFQFKPLAAAVVLLCSVSFAWSLSIDRPSGTAVLGKPLNLAVKVVRSADEELDAGLCAKVDVLYGETQLAAGRVNVSTESIAGGDAFMLRVNTTSLVDEPVVSLYVHVGCKQTVSRRFVLLSELPSEVQSPIASPVVPAPFVIPQRTVTTPIAPAEPIEKPATVPAVVDKPAPIVRKKRSTVQSSYAKVETSVPRLRLAPIDVSQEWEPVLHVATELLSVPVEDEAKRQEAAVLWRYLNLSPKDMMRLNGQEQELAQLKRTMANSQLQMQELNQQLQNAEKERYANPLVYGLGGLIVLLLGGFAYFYHRVVGRGAIKRDWWKTPSSDSEFKPSEFSGDSEFIPLEPAASVVSTPVSGSSQAAPASNLVEQGVKPQAKTLASSQTAVSKPEENTPTGSFLDDLDFVIDAEPETPTPAVPVASVPEVYRDFENSITSSLRSINTHDMLDVRQQAEFFMTLGQYEEAIDLLQNSISQSEEANPLVYLDLLKMLHTLSRRTEFDSIRKSFNRIFSGRVPSYAGFNEPSKGLENYPELYDRIVSIWPTAQAIEFIEASLVRGTDLVDSGRVELEAFRDLLMLHGVATILNGAGDSADAHTFSTAKATMAQMPDFADSEPMMLDLPLGGDEAPESDLAADRLSLEQPDLLLPPTFSSPAPAAVDLDLSDNNSNLIDFDPSIFSLDLPQTKTDETDKG